MREPGLRTTKPASDGTLSRLEAAALRVPFTLATVSMLALAGWLTNTAAGEQLGAKAIERLGFAPADTLSLDVMRAVVSVFVTNGPAAFWVSIVATAVLAGLVEWRYGTLRAVIAFWGTQFVTVTVSWILIAPLHLTGDASARLLFLARDVGPSAGYMGCLGFLLYGLSRRARAVSLAVGLVILTGMLALSLRTLAAMPAEVGAALSHLVALPIGLLLGFLTLREQRRAPEHG